MKLILLVLMGFLVGCTTSSQVIIGEEVIDVEIADTADEMATGLMFREELCESCGMWFVFEKEGKPSFWMKNTLIDLDMVFVNGEMRVVDVLYAVPCEGECEYYTPKEKALYVLEVNGGTFDESLIGQVIEYEN